MALALLPAAGGASPPNLRFEHLSIDQGLSQNSVFAILQDRTGFLWFGTSDGLNRYDGYSFEVLRNDPSDINSLSHNRIQALVEDRGGRYDPRRFRRTALAGDPGRPGTIRTRLGVVHLLPARSVAAQLA